MRQTCSKMLALYHGITLLPDTNSRGVAEPKTMTSALCGSTIRLTPSSSRPHLLRPQNHHLFTTAEKCCEASSTSPDDTDTVEFHYDGPVCEAEIIQAILDLHINQIFIMIISASYEYKNYHIYNREFLNNIFF